MGQDYIEISGYVVGKIHSQIKPVVSVAWSRIFVCFLALIIQRGGQRKFWFKLEVELHKLYFHLELGGARVAELVSARPSVREVPSSIPGDITSVF